MVAAQMSIEWKDILPNSRKIQRHKKEIKNKIHNSDFKKGSLDINLVKTL